MSPQSAAVHANLGDLLRELGRFDEAAASYRRASSLNPDLTHVYQHLAAVLKNCGKLDEATEVLRQWQEHEPGNPIVRHMIAAYSGEDAPPRASNDYVRRLFDDYAPTFDDDLNSLDYAAPRLIGDAVVAEVGEAMARLDVLDAGCGTGLCGPFLRPMASRLIGVDLSPAMLQHARALNLYDKLVVCELVDFLEHQPRAFDLIVAADTFNYFGELESLLTAAANALRGNGMLIYTLEQCDASGPVATYQLNSHGRYSHNEDYARRCMRERGLAISSMELATLRRERAQSAMGIVVRAKKLEACDQ